MDFYIFHASTVSASENNHKKIIREEERDLSMEARKTDSQS